MPNFLEVIIVGLILSADSFSAALAMGFRPHKFRDSLKFAFSSGGAEALVTFLGAVAGSKILAFDSIDHWISFVLLTGVAIHMAYEGFIELKNPEKLYHKEFHSFFKVVLVSFATSLDAFAVGISIGISDKPLLPFVCSIGFFAFISTIIGMNIAKRASNRLAPIFSLIGSTILVVLAVKILIQG